MIICTNITCAGHAFNENEALLRQWEWTQDESGKVYWLCRRCHQELSAEGA